MRHRLTGRRRALLAVAAPLAALLALTGCENPAEPDAARVDGVDISQESLDDTLAAWAAVPDDPFQLTSDTPHSYAAGGVAALLSAEIVDQVVRASADRYGLVPDPELMSSIEDQISQSSGGASPLDALSADERQKFLEAQALQTQLFEYADANPWWDDEDVEAYDRLVDEGTLQGQTCVHHILVDTEDEANQILTALDDGESFETLALERSTDTGSGEVGGDLGCNAAGTFVPEFEDAMNTAAVGEVVGPVESEFGFHIIRVDSREGAPSIEQSGSAGWLAVLRETTKVHVDPRYGAWDPAMFAVTPPEGAVTPASDGLNLEL